MLPYPRFDEVYSVSDLHLGGSRGFQIFRRGPELADLIDLLRGRETSRTIGLVLNGDVVDFLAEKPGRYLDAACGVKKLQRIIRDDAFAPVWKALQRYVRTPGRNLVFVLGNHDVELALPTVRDFLRNLLCGDTADARSRLGFALDGAGYRCRVRDAQVLFIHGNEFDPFNVVDYGSLLEMSRALHRALPTPDWSPNAGTRLVIDVMNQVKQQYRWIDLLKPEVEATIPVMVAIEPSSLLLLRHFGRIGFRAAWDGAKLGGLLSAEEEARGAPEDADIALLEAVERGLPELHRELEGEDVSALLRRTEEEFAAGREGLDLVGAGDDQFLGIWSRLGERVRQKKAEFMRQALRAFIGEDPGLDAAAPDARFRKIDQRVGPEIDFVVAGHTHKRKALRREHGPGFYFNSGTWIDLIHLTPQLLDDEAAFGVVWEALDDGGYEALDIDVDVGGVEQPLILRRPTVVRIEDDGRAAIGSLCEVPPGAGAGLEPIGEPFRVPGGS